MLLNTDYEFVVVSSTFIQANLAVAERLANKIGPIIEDLSGQRGSKFNVIKSPTQVNCLGFPALVHLFPCFDVKWLTFVLKCDIFGVSRLMVMTVECMCYWRVLLLEST